ncbi:MAG: hypothetical protein V7K27_17450 [Nostoc sp.]
MEQTGLIPDSIAKVAANEETTIHIVNPSHVGTTQVSTFPLPKVPDSVSQISFSHNTTTKINIEGGTLQINTTKVNTSGQIFTPVINNNISKISLPNRISPQQFLNSNSLSLDLHFSIPLLDNIYSTAPALWNILFDPTNPFDLTLQITDLPTGQLA